MIKFKNRESEHVRSGREQIDMQKPQNLQEGYLNRARQERLCVTLFLINGFQMRGYIRGFDNFVVLLEVEGRQQMIYKHAISTVAVSERRQPVAAE
jgi:host factor-I protein